MTDVKFVGDPDGIALWYLMNSSTDKIEQEYIKSVAAAAIKYGKVYFTDIVTQRESKMNNQTTWMMIWDENKIEWNISLFHIPNGAPRRSKRLSSEPIELSVDDIIV
jgi:hypothetical protein